MATFTDQQRRRLSKQGKAMKGGGFPIRNAADLSNAVQAFGRAKNPDATKAWIKTRARALRRTDLLPPNW